MKLTLSPARGLPGQAETRISVAGDSLTVDGTVYDLSPVPEGGEAQPGGDDHPFIGTILRQDGVIACTLRVVLGPDAAAEQPGEAWVVEGAEGPVSIPALRVAPSAP